MVQKSPFLLFFSLLVPLFSGAQITLGASDVPPFGAVLVTQSDTLPIGLDPGGAGAAVSWDFSMLEGDEQTSNTVVDPAETPFGSFFPQATFAFVSDADFYSYAQVTSDVLFALGGSAALPTGGVVTVAFAPAQQLLTVPATFGSSFSNNYGVRLELDGSVINPLLDSIRIIQNNFQQAEIDAYGNLALPDASYEVLRQRVETHTTDSIFIKFFGVWSLFDVAQDTSLSYEWWAAGGRGQVLTLEVDAEGNVFFATYLASYIAAPVAAFSVEIIGEGEVAFTDESANTPTQWMWDFGDGNSSEEQNPTHTYEASGEYEVCLTASNAGGEHTACQEISIVVTNTGEALLVEGLKAYPSPSSGLLSLEFGELAGEPVQFSIFNTLGQSLRHYRLDLAPAGPWVLDVSTLPPGLYHIAVQAKGKTAKALSFLRSSAE